MSCSQSRRGCITFYMLEILISMLSLIGTKVRDSKFVSEQTRLRGCITRYPMLSLIGTKVRRKGSCATFATMSFVVRCVDVFDVSYFYFVLAALFDIPVPKLFKKCTVKGVINYCS